MSQFFGAATLTFILAADDRRLAMQMHQDRDRAVREHPDKGYRTAYWPRSGFICDGGTDYGMLQCSWPWEDPEVSSGAISRVGYRGVTRDANNSPIGGVTVKIFRTADDTKMADDVVSDANGNFIISTPLYEPHYLVMFKSGGQFIGGVTSNVQYPNA